MTTFIPEGETQLFIEDKHVGEIVFEENEIVWFRIFFQFRHLGYGHKFIRFAQKTRSVIFVDPLKEQKDFFKTLGFKDDNDRMVWKRMKKQKVPLLRSVVRKKKNKK